MLLTRMQSAFNRATVAYKARIGDRRAWLDFHEWWGESVGRCGDGLYKETESLAWELGRVAGNPELLVCRDCAILRSC